MDLSPFIRELIMMNECIILRGVGGFETRYKHAVLKKNTKVLVPPSKEIIFRAEWIQDNGVLERHLAKSLKISQEHASAYIDDFVQRFFNTLKEEGSATMEGIGHFRYDEKSNLQFKELKDTNYLADSFGLDALELDLQPPQPITDSPEPLKPVEQSKRKQTVLYITIGVLLLVISVTLIILLSEGSNFKLFDFNKRLSKSEQLVFGNRPSVSHDSATRVVEQHLDDQTSTRVALAFEEEKDLPDQEPAVTYYLIAGSFKTTKNAELSRQELLDDGFDAEVVPMGENLRVVVGTFYNRKQALDELRRLRQQIDQSIWLLEKR